MGDYNVVLYLDHHNQRFTVTGRRSPLRVVDRQMEAEFPGGVREVVLSGVNEEQARARVEELIEEWENQGYDYFVRGTPA